jgi:Na+/proline symporter
MFALMGIQSSPAFSMWAFSNHDPSPFAPQQVWASSFGIGLILFLFTAMQGLGTHFLGADLKFAAEHPDRVSTTEAVKIQANFFEIKYGAAVEALGITQEQLEALTGAALTQLGTTKEVPTIAQMAQAGDATASALIAHQADLGEGAALGDLMDQEGKQGMLVPQLINLIAGAAPWLVGLRSVCALAAMQSTGAAYMSTAGGMLTRDLIRHFLIPNASHGLQKLFGRIGVGVIVLLALLVATTSTDALVLLGGLAVAYGFQMWPALIAVCYWPWLTRAGVVLGLIAGLIGVTLTESIGQTWFGITAWGRWPLTIHSAGWGIFCNLGVALIVSAITRDDMDRKMEFHNFLAQHAALPPDKKKLVPVAWILTLGWFFFAIGPGVVIGNWVFGSPTDTASWMFGMPSIWAWQLVWWVIGVFMMWFLAYVMQMSTVPETEVESLAEDIAEIEQART